MEEVWPGIRTDVWRGECQELGPNEPKKQWVQEQIRDRGGPHGWKILVSMMSPRTYRGFLLGLLVLLALALSGCRDLNSPHVFYVDENGVRSLSDACGDPLPQVIVERVDGNYDPTGEILGSFTPPEGSSSSMIELSDAQPGYSAGPEAREGTWASITLNYGDGVTGLIVPWSDLPPGSGFTFQSDAAIFGSLDEVVAKTKSEVQC